MLVICVCALLFAEDCLLGGEAGMLANISKEFASIIQACVGEGGGSDQK